MASRTTQPLQVAIIGGGICGLTCAIALAKKGIQAQVYEAAACFKEIGAGMAIGRNAVLILDQLGLLEDVLKHAGIDAKSEQRSPGWAEFYSGANDEELIYNYEGPDDVAEVRMHRAAFLDALIVHVDPACMHLHKRCIHVEPLTSDHKKLKINFADGTDTVADVVLGADGIHSAVRGAVTGKDPTESLSFSNTVCYRGLVPMDAAKKAAVKRQYWPRPVCYVGKDKHIVVYGIGAKKMLNVVAFSARHDVKIGDVCLPPDAPAVESAPPAELLTLFEGWSAEVAALLGCIEQPRKWNISVVQPPLESYVKRRIALLGDAAHAMLPHLGAGAGQGIEDAVMLAALLGHPQTNADNVEFVLKAYDEIRQPRVQAVCAGAVEAGRVFGGQGKSGATPGGIAKDLAGMWDFVWYHELEEDVRRAMGALRERGVFSESMSGPEA